MNDNPDALDREFNSSATMSLTAYHAQRAALLARAALAPVAPTPAAPAPAVPAPVATAAGYVSVPAFTNALGQLADTIAEVIGVVDSRVAELEKLLAVVEAAKIEAALESAERRLSRHADHLARLETRLQALERAGK